MGVKFPLFFSHLNFKHALLFFLVSTCFGQYAQIGNKVVKVSNTVVYNSAAECIAAEKLTNSNKVLELSNRTETLYNKAGDTNLYRVSKYLPKSVAYAYSPSGEVVAKNGKFYISKIKINVQKN